MSSTSPRARTRRRRRRLLLGATLATGAALWGARTAASSADADDLTRFPSAGIRDGDELDDGGEDGADETLHDVWPG